MRLVQDERKAAGLQVSDRIRLAVTVPADRVGAVQAHAEMIAAETLATEFTVEAGSSAEATATVQRVG